MVVGVVRPDPGRPDPVVTPEETISAVIGPHQINRWMGITCSGLAESNRHRVGDVGDFGRGDRSQPHIGVSVEPAAGGYPNFPGDAKNGPWPISPG